MAETKKICVFGATGKTGQTIIDFATDRGMGVVAFCRPDSCTKFFTESVTLIPGSLTNGDDIDKAVAGADAVVCALGPREPYRDVFCADATAAIIASMKKHGVRRLICVTGAMIGDYPKSRSRFIKVMAYLFSLYRPEVAKDRAKQEDLIEASGLDWTIVKPPQLIDENEQPKFRHGEELSVDAFSRISRFHLSEFILDQIDSNKYIGKRVVLRY